VVVCHGGVVDGSLLYFFGLPTLAPLPTAGLYTRNTSLTLWEQQDDARGDHGDGSLRWHLKLYNDDLHTRDIEAPERIRWTRLAKPLPQAQEEPAAPLPTEAPEAPDEA
jgi:2,3-bisphosphoglycerate-dependent phosphoglycerate mutase